MKINIYGPQEALRTIAYLVYFSNKNLNTV